VTGKLAKKSGLHVSSKTIKRALNLEGYHRGRACKKPFINRETQHARKVYAMIHLHKPVEFLRPHMYSDECPVDTSPVVLLGSLDFNMNAITLHRSRFSKRYGFSNGLGYYQLQLEVPINFFGWYREAWGSGIGLFKLGVRTGGRARFSGLVGV
jgi:hypothetical protein